MRTLLTIAALAALATAIAPNLVAAQRQAVSPAFCRAELTAWPADGWITNGGNLYNQRYSPLDADQPRQRGAAEGRVAHASERLRRRAASTRARRSRSSTTACSTSRPAPTTCSRSTSTPARSSGRTRRTSIPASRPSAAAGSSRGVALGDGKVFVGPARRQARRARSGDRQGRVVDAGRALAGRLRDHGRAALLRRPRDHRLRRRRSRHPRPREGVRREGRQADVDVLHDPRPRRARPRHLAGGQRRLEVRRRARSGRRRPSIPSSASSISRPAMPGPDFNGGVRAGRQPVHRRRSSPSKRRPASTAGTSSRCTTTSGTTTRRIPSCCSTRRTAASRARASRRSARPAGSTSSIARPASR